MLLEVIDIYLAENELGPMMFKNGFNEKDIVDTELNFTFGGKKVLKRLLKVSMTYSYRVH